MKLSVFIIISLLSFEALARDWRLPFFNSSDDSSGGLRTVWSCPTNNRGEMPDEREVEIYYDENQQLRFRPDIFNPAINPVRMVTGLFSRRRSSSDVDECLRSFLTTLPNSIQSYQSSECREVRDIACTRGASDIAADVGRKIRNSSFFSKYADELGDVASLLPNDPQPVVSAPIPERTTPPTRVDDNATARARLLDYMTDNYSKFAGLKDFARHCPDLGVTTGVNENYCRQTMAFNNTFLSRLGQLFSSVRGEQVTVERIVQSLECLPNNSAEFRDLTDILRSMDRRDDCSPLNAVGDFKLFRKQFGHKGFTTGNYLLKKSGDNAYEATLNLRFKNAGGSVTPEQMMTNVRTCLAQANRSMKGPGGETLALRVLTPDEANSQLPASERPAVDEINIQPQGIAIDAANFTGQIDCPTITHELLHHLGLCDEYKEDRTNIVHGMTRNRAEEWSCRVVPEGTSIMKNHVQAFNAAVPQQFTCNCTSDACRSVLRSTDPVKVGQRKILMTSSMYGILRENASYCKNPIYLTTVNTIPDPDKAFVDVQSTPGRLTFQNRSLFSQGSQFLYSRANVTCECPAGDTSCASALAAAAATIRENPPIDSCPLHTTSAGPSSIPEEGAETSFGEGSFTLVTTPARPSLLYPNQFDKILTGACTTSPGALFKTCSDYAYIPQDSAACANKPAECSDSNRYFGVTAQ